MLPRDGQQAAKGARCCGVRLSPVPHQQTTVSDGRFKAGESGNPHGRPVGSKNRKTLLLEKFEAQGAEVAQVVVDAAKAGDMAAANIVLSRLAPPLRPQSETVEFELSPEAPLLAQGKAVLAAVAQGKLSVDHGKVLIDCLHGFAALRQVDDLAERIKALEEAAADTSLGVRGHVLRTS